MAVPYSLPLPAEDTNWKVAFEPPSDITLVGSWANKVSVKPKDGGKFGVDLAMDGAGARVSGGLGAGTRIVTAGIQSLKPGQKVRIEQHVMP